MRLQVVTPEKLHGRIARCSCGNTAPSATRSELFAFEYRGEGSHHALCTCKHCHYYDSAHGMANHFCKHFEAAGPHEFDLYYCGCRGWD